MRLIALFFASLFFVNAFAADNSTQNQPLQMDNPSQYPLPPQQRPALQEPPARKMPERKAENPAGQSSVKVDESKVYLDFRDTDMKEVARIFSKISGVGILVSENVKAKVTLNIEGVNWEKALELILKTYGLTSIRKDNFIVIITYKEFQDEQEQIPLVTKMITLNFASPDDAKAYVKAIMTKRGTIESDKKTNTLIITDTPDAIERVTKIITGLDKKTPQVLIEVWMIDKSLLNDWEFGIDWQVSDKDSPQFDPTATGGDGNNGIGPVNTKYTYPASVTQTMAPATANDFVINYGKSIMNYLRLGGTLKALQNDTNTKVLANPRILTLDNVSAEITITDQIPYTDVSNSTQSANIITSTQFKDATTKLVVKPHITPDNNVIMEISTEQGFKSGEVIDTNGKQPLIATRKSINTMIIKNMETVVLGGLRARTSAKVTKKIPVLGDIPGIGRLFFQSTTDNDTIRELIIFVTPIIIREESLGMGEREESSLQESKNLLPPKTKKSKEPILKKLDPQTEVKKPTIYSWLFGTNNEKQYENVNAAEENKKVAPKMNISALKTPTPKAKLEQEKPINEGLAPDLKHLKMLPLKTPNETF